MRFASCSAAAIWSAERVTAKSIVDSFGPEVETLGSRAVRVNERGRQHVLAGVLLHVIEAPRPVDAAAHLAPPVQRRRHDVRDAPVVEINHVLDANAIEETGIEGLPARGRIERGPIEHDRTAPVHGEGVDHRGGERREVRVGVVETGVIDTSHA